MSYKTLMVNIAPGEDNAHLFQATRTLAKLFDAKVIGVAACPPTSITFSEGFTPGSIVKFDMAEIDKSIKAAEIQFHNAFQYDSTEVEWRPSANFESVANYIARECCSADLIITSAMTKDERGGTERVKVGDLVMQSGRPVLIVPVSVLSLELNHIVIAWKNTREARRAVVDALPLLRLANQVTLLQLAEEHLREQVSERQTQVVDWLISHDVVAQTRFVSLNDGADADQLDAVLTDMHCDAVVAGAYGHSRMQEWALGGVTRNLLLNGRRCTLLSH